MTPFTGDVWQGRCDQHMIPTRIGLYVCQRDRGHDGACIVVPRAELAYVTDAPPKPPPDAATTPADA